MVYVPQPVKLPHRRERLLFRAEVGAETPLWSADGEMVWPDTLPLSSELVADLEAWAAVTWDRGDAAVLARGQQLYDRCVDELSGRYDVVWDAE